MKYIEIYRTLGCDALHSDKCFYIFEEITINLSSKYKVDGFRNFGKFLHSIHRQIPKKLICGAAAWRTSDLA